jgi:hypothetical protein
MKRIISVLAVTALMVAMLVASAMPAFAAPRNETAPNCIRGQVTAAFDQEMDEGWSKHIAKAFDQCGARIG